MANCFLCFHICGEAGRGHVVEQRGLPQAAMKKEECLGGDFWEEEEKEEKEDYVDYKEDDDYEEEEEPRIPISFSKAHSQWHFL